MDKLNCVKDKLVETVYSLVVEGDIENVDAHELGEVIDVIKDISETKYYSSITDAMEETDDKESYLKEYLPEYKLAKSRMYFTDTVSEMSWEELINEIKDKYANASVEDRSTMKQVIVSLGEQM